MYPLWRFRTDMFKKIETNSLSKWFADPISAAQVSDNSVPFYYGGNAARSVRKYNKI